MTHLDPLTLEMATVAPGPGRFEWGTLAFERTGFLLGVELDEQDGSVAIYWHELADDFYGSCERRAHFTAEEFDQIIAIRAELRTREQIRRAGSA